MASITFTDGTGTATLDNGLTSVAGGVAARFSAWTPWSKPVGASAESLATGQRSMFAFRTDYGATFEVRQIPNTGLAIALRLIRHLSGGGTCTVTTGDTNAAVYTAGIAPGADATITLADPVQLTYTLALNLINLGAAADMLCVY